jgi:hypothetical protein
MEAVSPPPCPADDMEEKRAAIRERVAAARIKQEEDAQTAKLEQAQADDWLDNAESALDELYGTQTHDPGSQADADAAAAAAAAAAAVLAEPIIGETAETTSKSRRNKKKKAASKKKKKQLRDEKIDDQSPPELAVKNGKLVEYTPRMKVCLQSIVSRFLSHLLHAIAFHVSRLLPSLSVRTAPTW